MLIQCVFLFSVLRRQLRVLSTYWKFIALLFICLVIFLYFLALLGYVFLPDAVTTIADDPTSPSVCLTLIDCWFTLLSTISSRGGFLLERLYFSVTFGTFLCCVGACVFVVGIAGYRHTHFVRNRFDSLLTCMRGWMDGGL